MCKAGAGKLMAVVPISPVPQKESKRSQNSGGRRHVRVSLLLVTSSVSLACLLIQTPLYVDVCGHTLQ